jgi:hypothetical protein
MSLIEGTPDFRANSSSVDEVMIEGFPKNVRMANLAVIGAHPLQLSV